MSKQLVEIANSITEVLLGSERALPPGVIQFLRSMKAFNTRLLAEALEHNDAVQAGIQLESGIWSPECWEYLPSHIYKLEAWVTQTERVEAHVFPNDSSIHVKGLVAIQIDRQKSEAALAFHLKYNDLDQTWSIEFQNPDVLSKMRECVQKLIELDNLLEGDIKYCVIEEGGPLLTLFEANSAYE